MKTSTDTSDTTVATRLRNMPSRLISLTAVRANRLVGEGLATVNARRYHYALLATLAEFGPASQASLGRRCGMDRSDIVAAVNELAAGSFVERTPDPTDRRRNVITITPSGLRHLDDLDRRLAGVQDELLAPLSADERGQLVALLTRIMDGRPHH